MKENNFPTANIDIDIKGEKTVPREKMFYIKEEIKKLSTLYTIEIVDFKKVSEDFRKLAL